jgi:hypothetical protein
MPCIHIQADQWQAFAIPCRLVGSMGSRIEPSQKSIIYGVIGKSDPLVPAGSNINMHPMAGPDGKARSPKVGLLRCCTSRNDASRAATPLNRRPRLKTKQDA